MLFSYIAVCHNYVVKFQESIKLKSIFRDILLLNMLLPDHMRVLVLYLSNRSQKKMRMAIRHHLRVLNSSKTNHNVLYYNVIYGAPTWLRYLRFDAVILHTTLLCLRWSPQFQECRLALAWMKDFHCLKVALPQDEYDCNEILDEWLYDWGISVIFTIFDESHRKILYPIMHNKARFYHCFTGYIDDSVAQQYQNKLIPMINRPNDIVYRATHLPYWFGSHGQLKHQIADIVASRAKMHGLRCNISTHPDDTILGNRWLDFIASGKTIIGCESGSSVLDPRGELQTKIQAMLKQNPDISFEEVRECLPLGWDNYRFFAISPRHFEAVITKTCQILVEGYYDGVLEPNRHYIPLKRDFSNLDEVLEKIKDIAYIENIAEQAYQDIYLSGRYSYQQFAKRIEMAITENGFQSPQNDGGFLSKIWWQSSEISGFMIDIRLNLKAILKSIPYVTRAAKTLRLTN